MALHYEEFPGKEKKRKENQAGLPKTIGVYEEDIIQWGVRGIYMSEHHVVLLATPIALGF
jgi:hypothetical protein